MIQDFSFKFMKTQVCFGNGVRHQAGAHAKRLGLKKIMLVADKGIRSLGIADDIAACIEKEGISIVHFDQVVPNPRATDCEAGARLGMKEKIDGVVAIGGGSGIDSGKAIAGMLGHNSTSFADIMFPKPYTCDPLPLIAIPTTAGTGSECSTGCVIDVMTEEGFYVKRDAWDMRTPPDVALSDPELVLGLPNHIAAATAMDALTHAIEGYVSKASNPILDAIGLYAIELLHSNLRKYIHQRDLETCQCIMLGATLAGISFGYGDVGNTHTISEVCGGRYDIAHGVGNSIFLPYVFEHDVVANIPKYVKVAKAMGITGARSDRELVQAAADELRVLADDIMIPKFYELPKVNPADFESIAEQCVPNPMNQDNPRTYTKKDFLEILNKAYKRPE